MNKILALLMVATLGVAQADSQTATCKQLMKSLKVHIDTAVKYTNQNKYELVFKPAAAGAKEAGKYLKECNPSFNNRLSLLEAKFRLKSLSTSSYILALDKKSK